ncbi:helix-turn-helix domain-containing protein [Priestia megaterium]|uniref:helix-turn-helix domain-containing protein n=1 Tax=Priestia megaterium TaxID=1404 RepID=UPI00387826C8
MVGYKLDFSAPQQKKGLTDSELARRMNISRSSMGYLKVRNGIDFKTLTRLCEVLDVEPKDIIVKYELKP